MPATDPPDTCIGIDLSVDPKRTGACVLERRGARWCASFLRGDALSLNGLVDLVATNRAARIGIDSPFGWPVGWIDLLQASRDPAALARDDFLRGEDERATPLRLRLRDTDRHLVAQDDFRRAKLHPLSASMDKLAATTARCVEILHRAGEARGGPIDRAGADGVLEVYPAASLVRWGFVRASSGSDRRRLQHDGFLAACVPAGIDVDPADLHEHDLDALVAAVTVAVPLEPMHSDPTSAPARIEGVIHVPRDGEMRLA